jgi:hypothetical protein
MRFPIQITVVAMAIAVSTLGATSAEARFGKAGGGGGRSGGARPPGGGGGYSGGGGGGRPYYPGYPAYYPYPYYYAPPWYYGSFYYYPYVGPGEPYQPYYPGGASVKTTKEEQSLHLMINLGAEGQVRSGGGSLGANLMIEGERLGLNTQFVALFQQADDGTNTTDSIKLFSSYLTFAVLANEHGRLRLEGGVNTAFAPDMTAIGLSGGLSTVWGIGGPVGIDAALHYTPWPFIDVDWSAGLVFSLSPAVLRFGIRQMILDDRGNVDGVAHRDVFTGPYLGLAFFL